MDVFGVIVLGLVTALGGGTLRDTLLDAGPVFWVADRTYLLVVVVTCLVTFALVRRVRVPERWLLVADGFGLAVFTVVGTAKALDLTGAAGVALRLKMETSIMPLPMPTAPSNPPR